MGNRHTPRMDARGSGSAFAVVALATAIVVAASDARAAETFRDCEVCPEMVVIPPGEFVMGSPESETGRYDNEGPQHTVRIERAFALGKHEVTPWPSGRPAWPTPVAPRSTANRAARRSRRSW